MIAHALTHGELLAMWDRGEGTSATRRAMAMVSDSQLWSLPVGRRDAALLELRELLFGDAFTGVTTCPSCEQKLELTFNAADVRREAASTDGETIVCDGVEIAFRLPTSVDLASIERATSIEAARAVLLERCVTSVSAREVPEAAVEAITARMAELDPQADVTIDVDCPDCAHAWREPFDIVTFVWNELASWARHLLADVHLLARAYGWSEESIVSMAPSRRNAYLEMVR